jgi:hypothetical protein
MVTVIVALAPELSKNGIKQGRTGYAPPKPALALRVYPLTTSPPFGCSTCPEIYDESDDARNT